jgi:hypothetical protein
MNSLDLDQVCDYVNLNIVDFHQHRLKSVADLKLKKLLRKNPYLFKAKNITTAAELISGLLEAFLSSSEEKLFGDFLENLAIFIAGITCNGHKSSASGIDLEFMNKDIHYLVSVKSGPNWGNSSQQAKLQQDFQKAVARIKQSKHGLNVQPVLGICYGKTKTSHLRGYIKSVGQTFWYFISENEHLYTDIVEPIGYKAKEHNDAFNNEKGKLTNRLTKQFMELFCGEDGAIDWVKLVEFNSKNLDLNNP